MTRRGFALLASLWFLVAVGSIAAWGFTQARLHTLAVRNRTVLLKAEWLREACVELARAAYHRWAVARPFALSGDDPVRALRLDSIPVGGIGWCEAGAEDAGAQLDVNLSSASQLTCLLGDERSAAVLVQARPVRSLKAAAEVLGLDPQQAWPVSTYLSVQGTGQVNINSAPERIVACLPGLEPSDAAALASWRRGGRRFTSLDAVISALPAEGRRRVLTEFPAFARATVTTPPRLLLHVAGVTTPVQLRSEELLIAVPGGAELAILRREVP